MLPRRVVLIAGLVATVATVQLIMNVAVGQTGASKAEPVAKVTSSVHVASAPAAAKKDVVPTVKSAPPAGAKPSELEMSVVDVSTKSCPDKESRKARLGLLEKSAVHGVCP